MMTLTVHEYIKLRHQICERLMMYCSDNPLKYSEYILIAEDIMFELRYAKPKQLKSDKELKYKGE